MLGNYLIGLREGLEASLVVSILVAYLVRVGRRDKLPLVASGVGTAIVLSVAFGAALTYTSTTLLQSGSSQEAFGGICSVVAVVLVTAMIFWMRKTARHLKSDLDHRLGAALDVGGIAVAVTAFVAVGREGLETALFFWSAVQAAGSTLTPVIGFGLGIATAVVLAWLLYRRSVKLNLARFFTWTGAGLIVVAAGVLGYAVHDLQEGTILGGLNNLAFDVSAQIPPGSWYGALLKGVFNFSPNTTWYQAIAYVGYLVPVLTLFFLVGRRGKPVARAAAAPATRPASLATPASPTPTSAAPTSAVPTSAVPTSAAPTSAVAAVSR